MSDAPASRPLSLHSFRQSLQETGMHWFTLRFPPAEEEHFRHDYFTRSLLIHRISVFASMVYFASFALLDYLAIPEVQDILLLIRFAFVCPFIFLIFLLSFRPVYRRFWQPLTATGTALAGLAVVAMTIIAPDVGRNYYYVGTILVLIYCYMLLRLRFVYAVSTGFLIVAAYILSLLLFPGVERKIAVTNVFFQISANILGVFAAYTLEYYYRRDYFHRRKLQAAQQALRQANEHLEEKVREKTLELQQDLDLRRRTELELIRARDRAEQSDRLKSAFLANMSHEMRTPLNGILGFAELLKTEHGGREREFADIIQKSGQRMLDTIEDLIDISRIEAGIEEARRSLVDVQGLAEDLITFFQPEAEAHGLDLRLHSGLLPQDRILETDKDKLTSILTNLLKNALKYTRAGSIELTISTGHDGFSGHMDFAVTDTGIGIDENRLEDIFDRFVQAEKDSDRIYEGSGLGLSITRSYVQMLGGEIRVESTKGVGSTFRVVLPAARSSVYSSLPPPPEHRTITEPWLQNRTVLMAEDDPVSRLFLSTLLQRSCRQVLVAENGREAVDMARQNPHVDLILLDIRMPEMTGYEAARAIRQFDHRVMLIAQTAYAMQSDRDQAVSAGFDGHVSKPVQLSALQKCIETILAGRLRDKG